MAAPGITKARRCDHGFLSLLCLFPTAGVGGAGPSSSAFKRKVGPAPGSARGHAVSAAHGAKEVVTVSLSSQEQVCNQTDCLLRLADRYQAKRLVGGDITPNDKNYLIQVWIFDRASQQPAMTEARCSECSGEQLYDTAARTAGQLLEGGAGAPTPPARRWRASRPCRAAQNSRRCAADLPRPGLQLWTRGCHRALAALTGARSPPGFTFLGLNGRTYSTRSDGMGDITLDFTQAYRWSIGLSAIPAAATLAAALPWHEILAPPRQAQTLPAVRSRRRGASSFRRGLAVGGLGALAVAVWRAAWL